MLTSQTGSYIPKSDAGIRDWVNNFASIVAAQPAAVGMTKQDAEVLTGFAEQLDAAYQLAVSPRTRTPETVSDKDTIRNQVVETFRIYARQIKANMGIDENLKISLGVHVDKVGGTPIPAPVTVPVLSILGAGMGTHLLRYTDSATPDSRAKPPGAAFLELAVAIGDTLITDHREARIVGRYSRNPMEVTFEYEDAGKTASYFARWVTRRGLVGGWSNPVSMMVAFAAGPGKGNGRTAEYADSRTVRLAA